MSTGPILPDATAWSDHDVEEVTACPACESPRRELLFRGVRDPLRPEEPTDWPIVRCDDCRSAYLATRPTRDAIGRAYATYFTHVAPALPPEPGGRLARWRRGARDAYLRTRFGYDIGTSGVRAPGVLRAIPWGPAAAARTVRSIPAPPPGGRLLDVGCANGEYLLQMRQFGWDVEGIETDAAARAFAEGAGIHVRGGFLDDAVPDGAFDALTLGHVIEHVHDPIAFLGQCHRVLRPGGIIWLATPNIDARGLEDFGPDYVQLDPPRHLTIFSREALIDALRGVGFIGSRDCGALPQASAWVYARSASVQRGMGSHPEPLPAPPPYLRVRALAADLRAAVSTRRAEELVLIARKPS